LKPGLFANVTFRSKAVPEVVVPTSAVVISGERSTVYVEVAPWTFERRTIEVGDQLKDRIVVTKGLEAGARIIATNAVLMP
jgi:cobalt-zinc-cadmium efflux system membrane fusion protein